MKYIIADTDDKSSIELKKILDGFEMLTFQGSFTRLEDTEISIYKELPDILFMRIGKAELNVFKLTKEIRKLNPFSKAIFISCHEEYAVETFECEADGFLLEPFSEAKIKHLLIQGTERKRA